jgi:ankyrin repeat protein
MNVKDENGWTALYGSVMVGGGKEVVRALVTAGADVDAADENGVTAVQAAAKGGKKEIFVALVMAGCSMAVKNEEGRTALELVDGEVEQKMWQKALDDAMLDMSTKEDVRASRDEL